MGSTWLHRACVHWFGLAGLDHYRRSSDVGWRRAAARSEDHDSRNSLNSCTSVWSNQGGVLAMRAAHHGCMRAEVKGVSTSAACMCVAYGEGVSDSVHVTCDAGAAVRAVEYQQVFLPLSTFM